MSVPVLLFASFADAVGARRVELALQTPCTMADVVTAVRALPGGERIPERPLAAVNRRYAGADALVRAGDEVALIPPVAGG
jgi:molybdopterin converting factor small subunit